MERIQLLLAFGAALGGGLLIGIERERRKGVGPARSFGGIRTFALASLAGAGARALDEPLLVVAGALFIASLAAIAYWRSRSRDPGVTTEIALLVTYLLGVLAIEHAVIAAAGSVVVTILLASRRTLHAFAIDVLTETELRDGLLFAAAALILLPLLPATAYPWLAGNSLRRVWALVVLFLAIQAAGYIAVRAAGPRLGLSLSGFASGFVSSTGTIAALGVRARQHPALRTACVAGALFSSVTTVVLLGIIVVALHPPALAVLALPLSVALIVSAAGATAALRRQHRADHPSLPAGRAFHLTYGIGFAAAVIGATAAISFISRALGPDAALAVTAIAGTFDVHAAAIATLSRAAGGELTIVDVPAPVLLAYSTNAGAKLVAAFASGGGAYGSRVAIGIVSTVLATWLSCLIVW